MLARMPVFGVAQLGARDAALGQPGFHRSGVVFGNVQGGVDQVHAGSDLDDFAACDVAFEFGSAELGGFEVELGAEDVA